MTTNLLAETERYFSELNLSWDDVAFIACDDFSISIENFRQVAATADYDAGYGAPEVAQDLVIVFKNDGWLERHEYDGAEGWVYRHLPYKPEVEREVHALVVGQKKNDEYPGWLNLERMNS